MNSLDTILSSIYEISSAAVSRVSLEEILKLICENATRTIGSERSTIFLSEGETLSKIKHSKIY